MDELMISGKRHAASIRIAKQYGYHSDYLGQLIRGGKIKGQKVGRAWYVDVESLAAYLGKDMPAPPKHVDEAPRQSNAKEELAAPVPAAAVLEESPAPTAVEDAAPAALSAASEEDEEDEPAVAVPLKKEIPAEAAGNEPAADEPQEEPSHHVPITVRVFEEEREVKKKQSGLRYVSEEEPLLPQIRKSERAPKKLDIEVEALAASEVLPMPEEKREARVGAGYGAQAFALATLGVLVFALAAAGSSLFVYTVSVGSAQTASVQFSIPQ